MSELDTLYYQYVNGDAGKARDSLLTGVTILEKASCFEESTHAGLLSLEYSRLAVLENKAGDKLAAEAYLLSAQYWQLKDHELSNSSAGAAMAKVKALDMQEATRFVEKMDRGLHAGELANYNKRRTEPVEK